MDIFVANFTFDTTDNQLRQLFEMHGTVDSAKVVMDRETNRSRGFGFVKMSNANEARAAIKALDGFAMSGRNITAREAEPRQGGAQGQRGGGYGGGQGGGQRDNRGGRDRDRGNRW